VVISCWLGKIWQCRKVKKEEDTFVCRFFKTVFFLVFITVVIFLLLIVASLSYVYKKTSIGQVEAEKQERKIKTFFYSSANFILRPLHKLLFCVNDFCWSLWDKLDIR